MRTVRRAVPPLAIAAADLAVGSLLYLRVSVLLGLLLLVCGVGVLVTIAWEPLSRAGAVLLRRLSGETAE
jgi:tetrahydromethanopterin S-methyltransferase subunit D